MRRTIILLLIGAILMAVVVCAPMVALPLVEPLQQLRFAYAPALVAVGVLMLGSIRGIDFDDLTELVPAFVTIIVMVFTYNIGNGLTAGLLLYPVIKVLAGRKVNAGSIVLALICLSYYLFGLPH